MINVFRLIAQQRTGMPPQWDWIRWEALGDLAAGSDPDVFKVTGAVMPNKKRGPMKGCPSWRNRARSTERTVYITPAERDVFLRDFEAKTGICYACSGSGEPLASWHYQRGCTLRECRRCGGTGRVTTRCGGAA